jgi:hypothetical protein
MVAGTAPVIAWNIVEQLATNTNPDNAMINIDALASGGQIADALIFGNQMNALGSVGDPIPIRIGTDALNTRVDANRIGSVAAVAGIWNEQGVGTLIGTLNSFTGTSPNILDVTGALYGVRTDTIGGGLALTAAAPPIVQRAALTGVITATQGSNTTAFGTAAALSVLANLTSSTAVPAFAAATNIGQVLRVNDGGTAIAWGAVNLALNGGSGTQAVTGILAVANGGTGLASGTSGGVLCYTATGTIASSAALTAAGIIVGGGAGACPTASSIGISGTSIIGATKLRAAGSAPALTSCGTSPAIVGGDMAGEVTMGTATPTGCVITFAVAYSSAPYCVVSWQVNIASMQYTVSTSAITLVQTATSSNKVNYVCIARSAG